MKKSERSNSIKSQLTHSWKTIALVAVLGALGFGSRLAELIPVPPPSPEIKQLADATTMTPEAQQVFYRQKPTIQPKAAFKESCQQVDKLGEGQLLLGCYISNGRSGKIVIQSIRDARFNGMTEAIAAHEMLHAVYNRLSPSERDALTPRLKQATRRVTDRHLVKILKKYEEAGDSERFINELHSHLGTELEDLGDAELEQHYRRYFADRQQVVALAKNSQSALRKLDEQGDRLNAEIDALEANLKSGKLDLKTMRQSLDDRRQNLDTLHANLLQFQAQAGQTNPQDGSLSAAIEQFEQMKSNHNQQVREYNEQLQQFQDRVDRFNQQVADYKQKIKAYNDVNHEERSLLSELDSNLDAKK
jgi:uncharacterized coiled-coil DUF342 family protein